MFLMVFSARPTDPVHPTPPPQATPPQETDTQPTPTATSNNVGVIVGVCVVVTVLGIVGVVVVTCTLIKHRKKKTVFVNHTYGERIFLHHLIIVILYNNVLYKWN